MAIEFISILSIPRTGTNYLCGLMGLFKEIDSLFEIYHNRAVYIGKSHLASKIIDYINCNYQLEIKNHYDTAFVNFVRQHPQEMLDIIRLQSNKKYISFKIFPNHLSEQNLNDVIIQNKRVKKILIKRNLLNVYLSLRFAEMIKRWSDRDTSNLKLNFEINDFVDWYARYRQYYDFIESKLKNSGGTITVLEYEQIHSYHTNRDKFTFIYNFLNSNGLQLEENNLSISEPWLNNLRVRQDKRVNVLDKVNNPQLLVDALKERQLEFLLNSSFR